MKTTILKTIIKFCLIVAMMLCANNMHAQGKYTEYQKLSIGNGVDNPYYGMNIHGLDLINFGMFQVDLRYTLPIMKGLGWGIYFHNRETDTYNDLYVGAFYESVNGERYDLLMTPDTEVMKMVNQLSPVSYSLKKSNSEMSQSDTSTDRHIGFIAQEVETIAPYAVATMKDGMKAVNYNALIPAVIVGVSSLKDRMAENQAQIERINALLNNNK